MVYYVTCTRTCTMEIEADNPEDAEDKARNMDWDDEPQYLEVVVDSD